MQKIVPHLWFDTQAKEAAEFYTATFKNSKITNVTTIHDTPSGDADIVNFSLMGQAFMAISAGPMFKLTPTVSFLVACTSAEDVNALWAKLIEGGSAMMELGSYPFSERYGWLKDKYGLTWQLMHMGERPITQSIVPTIMFVGDVTGKAEEAVTFYTSVFKHAKMGDIMRHPEGGDPDLVGGVAHVGFTLEGQEFAAMDGGHMHKFSFNEGISLIVNCDTQEEVDYYWEKLSAHPEAEQCGWLKDKYGLSWQVVPTAMGEMFKSGNKEKMARVTQAFLKMKKFDIAALQAAYDQG